MDRTAAAALAGSMYPTLRSTLSITSLDDDTGLKGAIDGAFVRLGVAPTDLATAEVDSVNDLAMYHVLRLSVLERCREVAATLVDTHAGDPQISKRYSQMAAQIAGMQADVQKDVDALGLDADGGGEYGAILCNFLENSND